MNIFKKIKQKRKTRKNMRELEKVLMGFIISTMRIEIRKIIEKMIKNGELKVN